MMHKDDSKPARRGLMLVLSSPSGTGKTTLSRRLLAEDAHISLSVSATTRPARPDEVDGRDYWFVDADRFDAMLAEDEFLEWAHVFGNRYGTPRAPVEAALDKGRDILFDIDWQGTQQLRQSRAARDLVSIFLLPPSLRELESRLRNRASDSDDVIAMRMNKAADEISHWAEYDYVLVNDDSDVCLQSIRTILASERLRRDRQRSLSDRVRRLLGEQEGQGTLR